MEMEWMVVVVVVKRASLHYHGQVSIGILGVVVVVVVVT